MAVDVHEGLLSAGDVPAPGHVDDLVEVMRACNAVTAKLQRSHDALEAHVVRLEQDLEKKNEQLQRSKHLAALGQMAAGIAHEVRNPLQAIQLYAGMITDDLATLGDGAVPACDVEDARCNANKIASAVHGLDAIVSDVLRFAGDIRPRCADISVASLVTRAVDAQRPLLEAMGARVETAAIPEAWRVRADAELMHQAMINLIRNASEAMEEVASQGRGDRPGPAVRVDAGWGGADIVLRVSDDGPGIPPEVFERIFDPFYTTRSTGTGLGLTIVHRIIDAHGGAIRAVPNEDSRGALFEIRLPVGCMES